MRMLRIPCTENAKDLRCDFGILIDELTTHVNSNLEKLIYLKSDSLPEMHTLSRRNCGQMLNSFRVPSDAAFVVGKTLIDHAYQYVDQLKHDIKFYKDRYHS